MDKEQKHEKNAIKLVNLHRKLEECYLALCAGECSDDTAKQHVEALKARACEGFASKVMVQHEQTAEDID